MWVPNLAVTLPSALVASIGGACLIKDLYGGPPYNPAVRADGRTVVVTGASGGIGREAACDFAKRGAKVFMACRDMQKCEVERRDIVSLTRNKYVYCRPCDLASLDSVREFVERFKSEEPKLDVLVTNAAVMTPPRVPTRDGFEPQLAVNHLGHFLLTNLLVDHLKASGGSRVVVLSCTEHRKGALRTEDLNYAGKYDAAAAYAQSKLANVLFATELAKRMLGHKVSVVVVDPGLTDSSLTRHLPMWSSVGRFLVYPIFWMFMKSPRIAAQTISHAALDPELENCTGDYYVDMKKVKPSKNAIDFEKALWLWKVSEKWTRLDEHKAKVAAS